MPNWKKIIVSGSDANLKSLYVANAVTASVFSGSFSGSLFGTSSWSTNSLTASYVTGSIFTSTNPALSSSYALTASYALSGVGGSSTPAFPFNGNAVITGSLLVSGSSGGFSGITGSLFGTASWATRALTASFLPVGTYAITSSWAQSSSQAATSSYVSTLRAAGPDQSIQFNDAGILTGGTNFTWQETPRRILITPVLNIPLLIGGSEISGHEIGLTTDGDGIIAVFDNSGSRSDYVYSNDRYRFKETDQLHIFSGSLNISGSVTVNNGITSSLFGTASWSINSLTASYALSGVGGSPISVYDGNTNNNYPNLSTLYVVGSGVTISNPSSGIVSMSIAGGGGGGGTGANVTASFTNQSTWIFTHNLNNQYAIIQAFDTSWNQIIPQNIQLNTVNQSTITFPAPLSGYAIASIGGLAFPFTGNAVITGSLRVSGSSNTVGNSTISGSIIFAPPTSPAFNGEIVQFGAGTLITGQLYFLSSSGTWSLANANSTGSSVGMLGVAVGSSPTTNGLLIRGFAASSSYTYGTGSIVYMATSSGLMTATSPSLSNHVVRVLGYQTTLSNTIYFDPDKTWVTLA